MSFTHEIANIYITVYVSWNISRYIFKHGKIPEQSYREKYLTEEKKEMAILDNLYVCKNEKNTYIIYDMSLVRYMMVPSINGSNGGC